MNKLLNTIGLLLLGLLCFGQLNAQLSVGGSTDLDGYVEILVQRVNELDPVYQRINELLNFQLPTRVVRDPEFYAWAENRLGQISYQLGLLRARANFLQESIRALRDLKNEYQRQNPYPVINYDMHRTIPHEQEFRRQQINAQVELYNCAIQSAQELYDSQSGRMVGVIESAAYRRLNGYLISYNQIYTNRRTPNQISSHLLSISTGESNRAIRDVGGMTPSEYKLRAFALEFLIPVFESAKRSRSAEGFHGAVANIFKFLPREL